MVLQSPAEGAEPHIQVEQEGVLSLVGDAGVAQQQPPTHVLGHTNRPVEERVRSVPQLQNGAFDDQIDCISPSQRLMGRDRLYSDYRLSHSNPSPF